VDARTSLYQVGGGVVGVPLGVEPQRRWGAAVAGASGSTRHAPATRPDDTDTTDLFDTAFNGGTELGRD
jgi:hypothetical protein